MIDTEVTTVVVHPGQTLAVDVYGNFEITLASAANDDGMMPRAETDGRRAMDLIDLRTLA